MNIPRRYLSLMSMLLAACISCNVPSHDNALGEQAIASVTPATKKTPTSDHEMSGSEKRLQANDASARITYLSHIASKSKITCAKDTYGNTACTADDYAVDFSDCGDSLSYGGIAVTDGVTLVDQINNHDAQPIARLKNKQFVCIEATASKHNQERYYIKAVPVDSVVGCKGNDLCKSYGDHPVQWIEQPSGKPCQRDAATKGYTGDCAAGWIDGSALEEFSMGL